MVKFQDIYAVATTSITTAASFLATIQEQNPEQNSESEIGEFTKALNELTKKYDSWFSDYQNSLGVFHNNWDAGICRGM